jgi:hypothetical protein
MPLTFNAAKTGRHQLLPEGWGEASFLSSHGSSFFNAPVQAKLTVRTPEDPQEKEAYAVTDKLMRMPEYVSLAPQAVKPEEKMHSKEEVQEKQPERQ